MGAKISKIIYEQLQPGDEFLVVRERENFSLLKIREVWQFKVLEILPEIARVNVTFPLTGHEEVAYFEMAAVGKALRVYFDPEKNSYFRNDNIIDIVMQ